MFQKIRQFKTIPTGKLAGTMAVVMDLVTRRPLEIWVAENPSISDVKFAESLLNLVKNQTLLLWDRGFYHFEFWQKLINQNIDFITRIKKGTSVERLRRLTQNHD